MNKLTKVEKQFLAAMEADPEAPHGLYDPNNQQDLSSLREKIRITAYHEAGHFAAKLFTQLELSHVLYISIIPENGIVGCMIVERPYAQYMLASHPPYVQRCQGMMLLLEKLAGYGTEIIMDKSDKSESIYDYCECKDLLDEENQDFFKANLIAEIMARPHMPVHSILKVADKWTLEMLRIPAVWNALETVACKLIKQGKITIVDGELSTIAHEYYSNAPYSFFPAKWMRRLHPKTY